MIQINTLKKVFHLVLILVMTSGELLAQEMAKTKVSIKDGQFYINDTLTYEGRYWEGNKIEGLLMNSRMVQGIFDDQNPNTVGEFVYPDTQKWDADRNTDEFVAAMPEWRAHGLLAFSLNLQGGSPVGYSGHNCRNSAFDAQGELVPAYIDRLERLLNKTNDLGMVVIFGYFYFGQDQYLKDENAVLNATDNITEWILDKGYKNLLIEINNECNGPYDHPILTQKRIQELIVRVREKSKGSLLVSTSYGGKLIPSAEVVAVSDFILLHGNGVSKPTGITDMVIKTKDLPSYSGQPILFNEDDHFNYDDENYNFKAAIKSYASWGYFDFRMQGEGFTEGYQSVPIDWGISSARKKAFFSKLKEITGQ